MLRLIISIFILFYPLIKSNAQIVSIGASAGFSLSNISQNFTNKYEETKTKFRLLPVIGITTKLNITEKIFAESGIFYLVKGYKVNVDKEYKKYTDQGSLLEGNAESVSLNYIQIPLNIGYEITRLKKASLQAGAGVYFAIATSGRYKSNVIIKEASNIQYQGQNIDIKFTKIYDANNKNMQVKNTDFGLNIYAGYKIDNVILNLQYSNGLTSLTPNNYKKAEYFKNDYKKYNISYLISITYLFNE